MTDLDLTALRAVAEATTPGEWLEVGTDKNNNLALYSTPRFSITEAAWRWGMGDGVYNCDDPYDDCHVYVSEAEAQAAHIAAFDPPTVLALIDRAERAEAERAAGASSYCDCRGGFSPAETASDIEAARRRFDEGMKAARDKPTFTITTEVDVRATPRVATSLTDLRVGQVVAWKQADHEWEIWRLTSRGTYRSDNAPMMRATSPSGDEFGIFDDEFPDEGTLLILSDASEPDPPVVPPPVTLTEQERERLCICPLSDGLTDDEAKANCDAYTDEVERIIAARLDAAPLSDAQGPLTDELATEIQRHAHPSWNRKYDGRGGVAWEDNGGLLCSCGWEGQKDERGLRPWAEYHRHVGAAVESIIANRVRAASRTAWEEGRVYGIAEAEQMTVPRLGNPYDDGDSE